MKKTSLLFLFIFVFNVAVIFNVSGEEIPYERFIGLGNCCVTRTQINHYLTSKFALPLTNFGGGQVFDWLVIHDYNKLSEAIENDLSDLLEREDLAALPCSWDHNYFFVRNTKYEMTWNHLFTYWSSYPMEAVLEQEYEIKKQKIDYLSNKFKQLKDYRTLYIVAYPFKGTGRLGCVEPDFETILRLRNALIKIRGNNNFTLLYCPLEKTFDEFENIFVRTIVTDLGVEHIGNYGCWGKLLSEFPYSLENIEQDKNAWANHQNW